MPLVQSGECAQFRSVQWQWSPALVDLLRFRVRRAAPDRGSHAFSAPPVVIVWYRRTSWQMALMKVTNVATHVDLGLNLAKNSVFGDEDPPPGVEG